MAGFWSSIGTSSGCWRDSEYCAKEEINSGVSKTWLSSYVSSRNEVGCWSSLLARFVLFWKERPVYDLLWQPSIFELHIFDFLAIGGGSSRMIGRTWKRCSGILLGDVFSETIAAVTGLRAVSLQAWGVRLGPVSYSDREKWPFLCWQQQHISAVVIRREYSTSWL